MCVCACFVYMLVYGCACVHACVYICYITCLCVGVYVLCACLCCRCVYVWILSNSYKVNTIILFHREVNGGSEEQGTDGE